MSSDDSATYSDAQSGDTSPNLDSSGSSTNAPEPRLKQSLASGTSIFHHSESLFLIFLFALIALLLPASFFYVSNPSTKTEPNDSLETRESPLTALLAYIPALSTLFRLSFSASLTLVRPFIVLLSLLLSLLTPIFIAVNVFFKVVVIVPARTVLGLLQFFYPLYLFCGTACILGGVVGLGGKLLVEGSRLMPVRTQDETSVQKSKGRRR